MMKLKLKNKILKIIIFIILLNITLFNFVSYGKVKPKDEAPNKPFYSKIIKSENLNEGVKVSIEKTDKYGNDQDEYTSVNILIENNNPYSDIDVSVEAIDHQDFSVITEKNKNYKLKSDAKNELNFDYEYKNYSKKFKGDISKMKFLPPYHFNASISNASKEYESGDKYSIVRSTFSDIDIEKTEETSNKSNFLLFIIAIVIIIVFFVVLAIIFIVRYINSNNDFYSFFIIISFTISLLISLIFSNTNTYAYNQQTFLYNSEYSHIYEVVVYHKGIPFTLKYKVTYKFVSPSLNIPANLDSDGDGLSDADEIYFLCDRYKKDTDGDGLSDYTEIYVTDTDPLKKDTDNNGILDSDEDSDKDGLTNIEEIFYGTFLDDLDTDGDNVSDYDELKIYNLDPLKDDTNGDGILDGEAVNIYKKLNLQSINDVTPTTKFPQELSRDSFDESLYMDNIIKVKVTGDTYGLIDNHIKVKEGKIDTLQNKNSILGKVCFIKSDYEDIPLTVSFDVSDYNLKLNYLKVATFDERGHIKLLTTLIDGNNISAEINNGYAFVIDIVRYAEDIITYKKDNFK